ncbi:MAG: ribonuclease PH, partial [candidate division Zixibacteria bacterium]|nr:ribonuclease PH [candidate division Zixibacteria bacterium]
MALALKPLVKENIIPAEVFRAPIAAISVGIVDGEFLVDLSYDEDSRASLDLNIVMNSDGNLIEIQGNAEKNP